MTWMESKENLRELRFGSFAGMPLNEGDELLGMLESLDKDTVHYDQQGTVIMDANADQLNGVNTLSLKKGDFAGMPMNETDELTQMLEGLDGAFSYDNQGTVIMDQDTIRQNGDNMMEVKGGTFAQSDTCLVAVHNLHHLEQGSFSAEQWYKRNPTLFKAEVAVMKRYFPQAKYKILNSGDMVWIIKMKISQTGLFEPWTFLLRYESDHPNNNSYGGSVHVLLYDPDYEKLKRRAVAAGRPGIPHVLSDEKIGDMGKTFKKLCTRRTEDVQDGKTTVTSAAQAAGWAGDWALHFELGLRDKDAWNKWCNDQHFRSLMI